MDNAKAPRRRVRRPASRRLIQLYSALLHNAYLRGFIEGDIYRGGTKYACAPGFNCYSCPGAVAACPLGALQNALAASGHRAGWYVLGILLLYGVILGRTVCGWLCPLGLVQELTHKIPTPKLAKSRVTRALTRVKYALLAVFAIAIPLWYGLKHDISLPAFCKYICPAGTLEGGVGLLSNPVNAPKFSMLGLLFTQKLILMLLVGLGCVFCYRAFCRFLCPLGAIYGLFSRFSVVGVRVDADKCSGCGACVRRCGMDVRHVGDGECIHCAKCMDACAQGAISLKAGNITLKGPEGRDSADSPKRRGRRRLAWGAALIVLCFALLWYNVLDPALNRTPATRTLESNAPVGHEVGQRLPDFTVECYDNTPFSLADARGKVVFINLWATWCAPCVRELPYFDALYRRHTDDVAVLAVHASLVTDDPEAYLSGMDYAISFATDAADDSFYSLVGGSATLPQTIVLNRAGEVIYNQVGSVTQEMLDVLYKSAQ